MLQQQFSKVIEICMFHFNDELQTLVKTLVSELYDTMRGNMQSNSYNRFTVEITAINPT